VLHVISSSLHISTASSRAVERYRTEKMRLVQRKGEAVEGEPRTTRQAAEKGELSVDRGERARKRGRPREWGESEGVPRVERSGCWGVPLLSRLNFAKFETVRGRWRLHPPRVAPSLLAAWFSLFSRSLSLSSSLLSRLLVPLPSCPSTPPTYSAYPRVCRRRGIMEILNQFENQYPPPRGRAPRRPASWRDRRAFQLGFFSVWENATSSIPFLLSRARGRTNVRPVSSWFSIVITLRKWRYSMKFFVLYFKCRQRKLSFANIIYLFFCKYYLVRKTTIDMLRPRSSFVRVAVE